MKDIKQFIFSKPLGSQLIVQKYLERPLLYRKRKFDIRVWALLNDRSEIYFYREGYLRTSSDEYTTESYAD